MADADRVREDEGGAVNSEVQDPETVLEQKTTELHEFRDAGILTETELEEQKAKLRWGIR
jgi:hypothetical protein